jgi:hypothetical protein
MMNALAVFPKLNAEQQDYLHALTEFVDVYDKAKPVRWPKIKGRDVLKYLMYNAENLAMCEASCFGFADRKAG